MLRLVAVLFASLAGLALVAAVAIHRADSPPAHGLTKSEAVRIARDEAQSESSTPVKLTSIRAGRYKSFTTQGVTPPNLWVWTVEFSGTFHAPSNGPVQPGRIAPPLAVNMSTRVILDYRTGAFVVKTTPALLEHRTAVNRSTSS